MGFLVGRTTVDTLGVTMAGPLPSQTPMPAPPPDPIARVVPCALPTTARVVPCTRPPLALRVLAPVNLVTVAAVGALVGSGVGSLVGCATDSPQVANLMRVELFGPRLGSISALCPANLGKEPVRVVLSPSLSAAPLRLSS